MPRFTLTQLLMGIALAAIIKLFTQTEGCGSRFEYIDALSFSSDNSRIAVSKIAGRNRYRDFEGFELKHVSRTISWLDAENGRKLEVIHQDYEKHIPHDFHRMHGSAICSPLNDRIAALEFEGNNVSIDIEKGDWVSGLNPGIRQIRFSKSGKYIAVHDLRGVSIIDARSGSVIKKFPIGYSSGSLWSRAYSLIGSAFSYNESKFIVGRNSGISVWDVEIGIEVSAAERGLEDVLRSMTTAPDETVIACTWERLERCDFTGKQVAELATDSFNLCCVSLDGTTLVARSDKSVDIFDLATNKLKTSLQLAYVEAIAVSKNGGVVALGCSGRVRLFDTRTGNRIWSASPPIRRYTHWAIPATFLVAWCIAAMIHRKRQKARAGFIDRSPERQV